VPLGQVDHAEDFVIKRQLRERDLERDEPDPEILAGRSGKTLFAAAGTPFACNLARVSARESESSTPAVIC
jgi:hypothetical protein